MNSKKLFSDLKAGIVVFLVALPLCLGIALACKAPLFSGLLAGIVGGIIVTVFSGSRLSVSGPAAGLTAIVVTSVASLGSFQIFTAAVLFAGILQIILGLIKAGGIANYIPNAVIKGMLAGIGIILIIKQIPHLLGYDMDPEGDFEFTQPDGHNTFSDLLYMLNFLSPGPTIVGILSLLFLVLFESNFIRENKLLSFIPAPLIIVALGIGLNLAFADSQTLSIEPSHLVNLPVISSYSDLKSVIMVPDLSLAETYKFWFVVITIAVVASVESLLSVEATDKLDPEKRHSDTSKELIAQGTGNFFCGLLGALPITAVVIRSSANIHAGAKTKLAAIIHALLLAASVLFFPHILVLIPNATLAAILILTGYKLCKPSLFMGYFRKGPDQVLPFIVTIIVMLLSDLLKGVSAGLLVSVYFIIRFNIQSTFDTAHDVIDNKLHYLIKLPQHVTFFNKGFLIKYLRKIQPNSKVIIDGTINKSIDNDAKDVIYEFTHFSKEKNIDISLINYNL